MIPSVEGAGEGSGAGRWKVGHAVAAFGTGVLASLVASLAVLPGGVTTFEAIAVVGGAQTAFTIGAVALLCRSPGRQPLGLRLVARDGLGLFLGAALEVALSLATYVVVQLAAGGEPPVQGVVEIADRAQGAPARVAVVVVTVLLAPVAEELVFRGVLLAALLHGFGPGMARYGSAAVFALTHLALDPNSALAVPALFVVGVVLAAQVQRSGRLGPALATHAGFNLVGVLALLYL